MSYLIEHLELRLDALNVHVVNFDCALDLPLRVVVPAYVSEYLQHPLLLLRPLLQLVRLYPQQTVLLSLTHVLAP